MQEYRFQITEELEGERLDKALSLLIETLSRSYVSKLIKEDKVFVLADDSGLEVDYLNKEPGIYSARYMGEDTSYEIKNQAIIDRLAGVPDEQRTARFVCAIACVLPDGSHKITRATIEGIIGYEIAGANGFGYDPIFYVPEFGCTTAELTPEQKNVVSHRGKALKEMKEKLREYFE